MKFLVSIPMLYAAQCCKETLNSFVGLDNVDILIGDNGADIDVKLVISEFENSKNIFIIREPENIYVNPIWNKFIKYFIDNPQYDYLIIVNSDLPIQRDFAKVLENRLSINPDEIPIPTLNTDKNILTQTVDINIQEAQVVDSGTAGVFIVISRKLANIVYPIPPEIKVWFGDNWIYDIARGIGIKTVIPPNLIAFHHWSQTVQKVNGISEIIEDDKRQWEFLVKNKMYNIISKFNETNN